MSTHYLTSPIAQPAAKKLRPCLSPSRAARSSSPVDSNRVTLGSSRSPSASSASSSVCTESTDGWLKRKCVRWQGDFNGCAVTSYFATYSATEYDRTPLAPPSEQERSCVMPERGSRCYGSNQHDEDDEDDDEEILVDECESEDEPALPRSPFATPEDSDSDRDDDGDDEWSQCFARRAAMFSQMRGMDAEGPQFEGFRSLSSTLADLLRSISCDDDGGATPRVGGSSTPADCEATSTSPAAASSSSSSAVGLFIRLRESSAETDEEETEIATPSLVSSADSDADCSGLASPDGSALDFLPGAPWKAALTLHREYHTYEL